MRRMKTMAMMALALFAASCGEPTSAPSRDASGAPPALNGSGLTVSISGNQWVSSAGTETYTASVSGGNGNYSYTWYTQSCNEYPVDTEWCESDPYPGWIHAQGSGVYQASRYRGIYDLSVKVTVYVTEIGGTKGGSATFWQYGPNSL
jgi:ABC-type glycerol-3-phosphate transport system substrate-binding protein